MMKFSIYDELERRVLVLDGGLGTMVQGYNLQEKDYRGERFADVSQPLKGCNDLLVITAPEVISRIHEAYLLAGADIISTDTFNANAISLADYNLQEFAYELNRTAAHIARSLADKYTMSNPTKPRFVAGSMGPTNRTASMSADVNNPAARDVSFDQLVEAYADQARGMADGGVDLFLVETIFDTLNAKAALFAIDTVCQERGGAKIPVMISGTLTDASGRTLSGQVVEAFYASIAHAKPLTVGLNCAFGARQLRKYLARLASVAECRISAHPNAGLPNVMGGYDETPAMMAADVEEYFKEGLINIIGGCCGTTPAHIGAIAQVARRYSPRPLPKPKHETTLSGLEPLKVVAQTNFVNIGERANVAGSAKFARLIREQKYDEALSVAREQVDSGAQIVDVCMDDGLINGVEAMTRFLNLTMSEPEISRVPIMIDSSSWEVLEAGLKCVQGKSIVNSISLKEGESEFVRRAKLVNKYGAAAVVMLFDERGQADTFARKIEVAQRAYDALIRCGFPAEDIIFDPNVLAIATGIDEHNGYGVDFIEACRWIKANLPHAKVSGGVSNLSFSYRGNNTIREAMHSVFLYHAISAGMDMGIVNPALLQVYSDIPADLLALCEDVILNRRHEATEELTIFAQNVKSDSSETTEHQVQKWRNDPLSERIAYALIKGVTDFIDEDTQQAYDEMGAPLEVIDKMLMPAMARIGELFGEGKMFLPQVVKSARVMKRAVSVLTPYIEARADGEVQNAGRIVLATVKGDVHDIGKNIVSVVMACNGYLIHDLGVMVDCERIIDEAERWNADVIGLSGLITPSLEEMANVVTELQRRGLSIPVIIGGATTSQMHTAIKIAPNYDGIVVQSKDASENITILSQLMGSQRGEFGAQLRVKQQLLREQYAQREQARSLKSLEQARKDAYHKSADKIILPHQLGRVVFKEYPIAEVAKYIDWTFFFSSWGIKGRFPDVLESDEKGDQARKLFADAKLLLSRIIDEKLLQLNGVIGIFPARIEADTIIVCDDNNREIRMAQLRNQEQAKATNLSLSDFICSDSTSDNAVQDYIGAFALTSGIGLSALSDSFKAAGDDYNAIMSKLLADRLAEAFAEAIHSFVRRTLWGYETEQLSIDDMIAEKYQGVRYAFGYPACPDHSLKKEVFELLKVTESTSMELTDNHMITPGESICGLIFADAEAKYFNVGHIDNQQLEEYAQQRGTTPETIAKIIAKI